MGLDEDIRHVEDDIKHIEERSFAWELIGNARRDSQRWFVALMIVLALWFSTIGIFVWYLNQYDYSSYEYQQDGEGYNNINTGTQGDVNNGAESKNNQAN